MIDFNGQVRSIEDLSAFFIQILAGESGVNILRHHEKDNRNTIHIYRY